MPSRIAQATRGSFVTSPPTEIEGLGQNWISHHQIPRLDGDQAERSEGNLPFASCLTALLSMTGHWAGQAFVEGEIPFSGVAQTVGLGLGRSKMLYLSMGLAHTLAAAALFSSVSHRSNRQQNK